MDLTLTCDRIRYGPKQYLQCAQKLINPYDVMLPAIACTVCEIFAFEL